MADSEVRKCLRCKSDLERVDGVYALTEVSKEKEGIVFTPNSGIPVVVYACPKCGKLELFYAVTLGELK